VAISGSSVLLLANTGTTASPNYVEVAEQTNLSVETTNNLIDASHKGSDHEKFLYGKQGDTISLESAFVPSDSAMNALRDAAENNVKILVRRYRDGVEVEEATALVESVSDEYPDNDRATTSIELTLNESWQSV